MRLIPPAYVKPYVKRQKNDTADAEAICEAAQRPSRRFVPVKSEKHQANGVVRLLILGASAVVRWAGQRGVPAGSWLAGMLARKPKMLVTVALANRTARIVWALLVKGMCIEPPLWSSHTSRVHVLPTRRKPVRRLGWP